jgi:hypothetical protein
MDHTPKYKMQKYEAPRKFRVENLGDLGYRHDFLDTTPKTRSIKKLTSKLCLIAI